MNENTPKMSTSRFFHLLFKAPDLEEFIHNNEEQMQLPSDTQFIGTREYAPPE